MIKPGALNTRSPARSLAGPALGQWVLVALAVVLLSFLFLPVVAVMERSIGRSDFLEVVTSSAVVEALRLSFVTTTVSLGLIIVFGTPLAYLLARVRFPGHHLVDTLVDLPMVLPPAVAGLGLLMAFGRRGILGQWLDDIGIELAFTTAAVVMAQTLVASPLYIRAAKSGFEGVDPNLELVSHTLGRSRIETFFRVAVPLARPALMAGAVMAWARALGEFGATIMFAGSIAGKTQTIPLAIYRSMETGLEVPLALSAILVLISFVVLFVFRALAKRSALYG